jgi:Ca2+-binding EF-hand superfamily protein
MIDHPVCLGYITVDELHEVLRSMNQRVNEKQMTDLLQDIDKDHDGKISYEEFVQLLQRSDNDTDNVDD